MIRAGWINRVEGVHGGTIVDEGEMTWKKKGRNNFTSKVESNLTPSKEV
jgi:hypothetical protein